LGCGDDGEMADPETRMEFERRPDEGRRMLAEIYNCYTEGFDTPT